MRHLIAAVALLGVAAVGVTGCSGTPQSPQATAPTTAAHGMTTPSSAPPPTPAQTVLPFTALNNPQSLAVDAAGDVYVVDYEGGSHTARGHVVKLAAGSNTQTVLPFTDVDHPGDAAVDTAGNVYVADYPNHRVVKLAAGSNTQTVLPFTDLQGPVAVAVDTDGDVYAVDGDKLRVVKLAAGSNTQTVLPFTDLQGPVEVAVDTVGNVYVVDSNTYQQSGQVLELAAESNAQTVLPFTGLNLPTDVAVDAAGNLYVVDRNNRRVLALAAGSNTQTVLPVTGATLAGVAVDTAGSVYVSDQKTQRVVELSAGSRTSMPAVTLDDLLSAPVPELCEHEAGNLVNGELPVQDPQRYGYVHIAHKSASDDDSPMVAFGDLTGDGVDDGAMVTACTAGGVGWPATVQLYTAGKTRLGGVDLGDVTHGGRESVTDITISDGIAHVSWITTGPGEAECCGTVKMAGDLRVKGANVVMENVRKLN